MEDLQERVIPGYCTLAGCEDHNMMKRTGLQGPWNWQPLIVEETTSQHPELLEQPEQPPTPGTNAAHLMELSPAQTREKDNRWPRMTAPALPSAIAKATQ